MAYTTEQLVDIYTSANGGAEPDAATTLTLDAFATQTKPGGGLSEAAALNQTLALVNDTTAVVIATYQFFEGFAPSENGLAFYLNNEASANDLNDSAGVYGDFNQDSRFINFSINLALAGTQADAFAESYGQPVTFKQTVASAYDKIIGNSIAAANGVDVAAAVDYLSRQENIDALTLFVKSNVPGATEEQVDLAVKAALIAQILSLSTSTGLGLYASATKAMIADYADDGHITLNSDNGVDLFAAYPGAGGGVPGTTQALTTGIDALVGTGNDDTFTGSATGATGDEVVTANLLDTIDGGAGVDTLNLADSSDDSQNHLG
jgi:S-layer protein